MNIRNLLSVAKNKLKNKGIDSFGLDSESLLAQVLKKNREYIHTYPEKRITPKQEKEFLELIKKRACFVPLAYLLGYKEFWAQNFLVGKGVLVPRPESELIVEEVLKNNPSSFSELNLIDIGTGSGCLVITLSRLLEKYKNIYFWGIDKYSTPLKYSQMNARRQKQKDIKFIKSSLLKYFVKNPDKLKKFNIVIANLPYLTKGQFKKEKSIQKEPKSSLLSSSGGLKHYQKLFKQIIKIKKIKPDTGFQVFCEINPEQVRAMENLIISILKVEKWEVKRDLSGQERLMIINWF